MSLSVNIDGQIIGPEFPPYIIAELSGNHLRSKERANLFFHEAKRAGANAVKIQTYTPESIAIDVEPERLKNKPQWHENWGWGMGSIYNLYTKTYTPVGEFTDYLFELGKKLGITVFSTPFSVKDVRLLAERYDPPAYKVASLEIDFFPMLEVIAQTKKPIIINTCIATVEKIDATIGFLERLGSGPIILLTGPKVYHDDAAKNFGLGRLVALNQRYGEKHVLGLSDHFLRGFYNDTYYQGHEFSVAGIFHYNASVIEKHFCGCRSDTTNPKEKDTEGDISIVTEEMISLVAWSRLARIQRAGQMLSSQARDEIRLICQKAAHGMGPIGIGPNQAEIDTNEAGATRFIYAGRDLPEGHALGLDDLHFSRAIHHANPAWAKNTPLPTAMVRQALGMRTVAALEKGDPIFAENLAGKIDPRKPYEAGLFPLKA